MTRATYHQPPPPVTRYHYCSRRTQPSVGPGTLRDRRIGAAEISADCGKYSVQIALFCAIGRVWCGRADTFAGVGGGCRTALDGAGRRTQVCRVVPVWLICSSEVPLSPRPAAPATAPAVPRPCRSTPSRDHRLSTNRRVPDAAASAAGVDAEPLVDVAKVVSTVLGLRNGLAAANRCGLAWTSALAASPGICIDGLELAGPGRARRAAPGALADSRFTRHFWMACRWCKGRGARRRG